MTGPLLRVKDLTKNFQVGGGFLSRRADTVHAVDRVSFDIAPGETLGLVGESGSGKSTTGRCILRLIEPTSGEVWFEGRNVGALDAAAFRSLCRDMQIIFQDPFASLNPRMTVGAIIGEALIIHNLAPSKRAFTNRVVDLLKFMAKKDGGNAVYRVTEVIGTSSQSWEDAARSAVKPAAGTLRDLRIAEIEKLDVKIENGKVVQFRARLALSFKYGG